MAFLQNPVSLFYQGDQAYGVEQLRFDLVLSESHDFNSIVTTHPIETGSFVSDNIHNALRTGGLTGFISNFSIYSEGIKSNRAADAFEKLKEIWKKREPVIMVTVLEVYESVGITSLQVARDDNTGDAQVFEINFQEIKQVTLQSIALNLAIKTKGLKLARQKQLATTLTKGRTQAETAIQTALIPF